MKWISTAIIAILLLTGSLHAAERELVYWDSLTEDGQLFGGVVQLPVQPTHETIRGGFAGVKTLIFNGPSSNRVDIVFVGDGYLEEELGDYATHVQNAMNAFFSEEPLASYIGLINVHMVEVISNESGVDNDPTNGIDRDTAMDMRFWCSGIERLLCVDVTKAYGFANNALDVDQVFAVANSTTYGGAGYTSSELATYAGGNGAATEIALHEWGHSLGNLADEYWYTNDTYSGPEFSECNASILTAIEMAKLGTKWAGWLGENAASWDGPIDSYEGCSYHEYGAYRPSPNSKMRSLGRPFNLPSAEGMLIEMYKIISPIDSVSPDIPILDGTENVELALPPTTGAMEFTIIWRLDGAAISGQDGSALSLPTLEMTSGEHTLEVTVIDNTPWVRDEAAREAWMQATHSWQIIVTTPSCPDITGDGHVGVDDLLAVIAGWGNPYNVDDLLLVIQGWGPCP